MNSSLILITSHMYIKPRITLFCIALALLTTITGCARKPWRDPITGDGKEIVIKVMEEIQQAERQRSICIDSDVNIFFTSHVKNQAIGGYLQLMQPKFLKFISSNPLGQPLLAFVSDGNSAQLVNTFEQLFVDGDLAAFATYYDLHPIIRKGDWVNWLTGRLPLNSRITRIREDKAQRGVWVSIENEQEKDIKNALSEHLLIDLKNRQLTDRVVTNNTDKIEARIAYSDWLESDSETLSRQPGQITVTELDYGGKLVLKFSDLQAMAYCRDSDFTLKRPSGYRYEQLSEGK